MNLGVALLIENRCYQFLAWFRILSQAILRLTEMAKSHLGTFICFASNLDVATDSWCSYEIFVFTVVPVGLMSFLTMLCSLLALYNMKK